MCERCYRVDWVIVVEGADTCFAATPDEAVDAVERRVRLEYPMGVVQFDAEWSEPDESHDEEPADD